MNEARISYFLFIQTITLIFHIFNIYADFLHLVIESAVDVPVERLRCPYLLERVVVTIIRAAIHLLDTESFSSSKNVNTDVIISRDIQKNSETENSQTSIWKSLQLLCLISTDVYMKISDRLGAGLLALLR